MIDYGNDVLIRSQGSILGSIVDVQSTPPSSIAHSKQSVCCFTDCTVKFENHPGSTRNDHTKAIKTDECLNLNGGDTHVPLSSNSETDMESESMETTDYPTITVLWRRFSELIRFTLYRRQQRFNVVVNGSGGSIRTSEMAPNCGQNRSVNNKSPQNRKVTPSSISIENSHHQQYQAPLFNTDMPGEVKNVPDAVDRKYQCQSAKPSQQDCSDDQNTVASTVLPAKKDQRKKHSSKRALCRLCLVDYLYSDLISLELSCGHRFCEDCLREMVTMAINEARVLIPCPLIDCNQHIHPSDIARILGPGNTNTLLKYERFMVRRVLQAIPDCRWCPAPDCQYAVIAHGCASCPRLKCEICQTEFCYHCQQIWHPDTTCLDASKSLTSKRKSRLTLKRSNKSSASAFEKNDTIFKKRSKKNPSQMKQPHNDRHKSCNVDRARAWQRENVAVSRYEHLSQYDAVYEKRIRETIKRCPRCKVAIMKVDDGSCNHMTCSRCGSEFCWLCLKVITDIHFLSPSGCTFWGRKRWTRRKKAIWQCLALLGAPVGISLAALISVPAIFVGLPVWAGRKTYKRLSFQTKQKRNVAVFLTSISALLAAPVIASVTVVIGVPVLLTYTYAVIPMSMCKNEGCLDSERSDLNDELLIEEEEEGDDDQAEDDETNEMIRNSLNLSSGDLAEIEGVMTTMSCRNPKLNTEFGMTLAEYLERANVVGHDRTSEEARSMSDVNVQSGYDKPVDRMSDDGISSNCLAQFNSFRVRKHCRNATFATSLDSFSSVFAVDSFSQEDPHHNNTTCGYDTCGNLSNLVGSIGMAAKAFDCDTYDSSAQIQRTFRLSSHIRSMSSVRSLGSQSSYDKHGDWRKNRLQGECPVIQRQHNEIPSVYEPVQQKPSEKSVISPSIVSSSTTSSSSSILSTNTTSDRGWYSADTNSVC